VIFYNFFVAVKKFKTEFDESTGYGGRSAVYLGEPKGIFCVFSGAMYAFTVQGANGAVVLCIVPLVSTVGAQACVT